MKEERREGVKKVGYHNSVSSFCLLVYMYFVSI